MSKLFILLIMVGACQSTTSGVVSSGPGCYPYKGDAYDAIAIPALELCQGPFSVSDVTMYNCTYSPTHTPTMGWSVTAKIKCKPRIIRD